MAKNEKFLKKFREATRAVRKITSVRPVLREEPKASSTEGRIGPFAELLIQTEATALQARQELCPRLADNEHIWKIALVVAAAESRGETPQVKTVALDTSIPQTTVLRALQAMESNGSIRRGRLGKDRRVVTVQLTQEARKELRSWIAYRGKIMEKALGVPYPSQPASKPRQQVLQD